MSNESFKIKNGLTLTPVDLTSLTNPQAGDLACDINDLNKIKRYDANSLGWTEVGSGGVGNVNALLTQTFDTAALAQFTQTGLALTTSNPIDGTQSARLIHQAASSQSFKQVIAVDRKYRGDLMAMSLQVRSSATSGNLTLLVTDETNSAVIMASSSISTGQYQVATAITNTTTTISGFSNVDINSLKVGMTVTGAGIPTATVISSINTTANTIVISQAATASATITAKFSALPDRKSFSFTIPTNCASLSYTVTALQEAGLPESYVDDVVIELANVSLLETSVTVPNLTAWQGYTPTFQGFGTPSAVEFEWRQIGENVEVRGKLTSGTVTAIEARISLPNGYTAAGTTLIPSLRVEGSYARGASSGSHGGLVLIEPSVTYFTFGPATTFGSTASISLSKALGTEMLSSSEAFSFFASVPCAGLSASSSTSIPLTQSGLVQEADSELYAAGNAGQVITAGVTKIPFAAVSMKGNAITWSGDTATINKSGIYQITGNTSFTVAGDQRITLIPSDGANTRISTLGSTLSNRVFAHTRYFNSGDTFYLISETAAGTLLNSTSLHSIRISYQGSLKQVSVNTNSKITIPTSELRFEGASTRGSTDTAIVKFDTQAKIRGDAFSVVNTAANGTVITMLKAGKLSVSASIFSSGVISISKNQSNLTSATLPSNESIATASASSGTPALSASCFIDTLVGDIIRITSAVAPTANAINNLNLSFQEQEIQVSVSNTLPQFSESDTIVKAAGNAGQVLTVSVTDIPFITVLDTSGGWSGSAYTIPESGVYNFSGAVLFTATASRSIVMVLNGTVSRYVQSAANSFYTFSIEQSFAKGDVVSFRMTVAGGTLSNDNTAHYLNISKVGKPNVTGVDVTPFVNIPQPVSGDASWTGYNGSSGSGYQLFDSALTMNGNSIFAADNTDGNGIKFLKSANITASFMRNSQLFNNSACDAAIYIDGTVVANNRAGNGGTGNSSSLTVTYSGPISAGQVLRFASTTSAPTYGDGYLKANVLATATSDTILTAPETFSTDTAALTYASSAAYTLATLNTAPVGTFITFTYAINTNTRTQTTTAPTQTTADMNTNGMLIYTRTYNAASTAAQPAAFAIQIGKGLKGKSLDLYKSAGKVTAGSIDWSNESTAVDYGCRLKDYNEVTGILIIDAGLRTTTVTLQASFGFSDLTIQASGYLVVNASKNPALTGLGLGTVAARAVNTAGTSIPSAVVTTVTYDAVKSYDTHGALNAVTGIFTAPETGYYQVSSSFEFASATYAIGNIVYAQLYKNGVLNLEGNIAVADRAASITMSATLSTGIYLRKNDTIDVRVINNRTAGATTLVVGGQYNTFSIHKTSVGTGN